MPENKIDNPVRLGQVRVGKNSKPRLLRPEVKSEKSKKSTMKTVCIPVESRHDHVTKWIYINNDSTPKDTEQFRNMREEKKRRTDKGETDLVITGGKVVKRQTKESTPCATSQGSDCHQQNTTDKTQKQKQIM